MNTGVTDFTRKTGVFFAYGVDGPEFPPALYHELSLYQLVTMSGKLTFSQFQDAISTYPPVFHSSSPAINLELSYTSPFANYYVPLTGSSYKEPSLNRKNGSERLHRPFPTHKEPTP